MQWKHSHQQVHSIVPDSSVGSCQVSEQQGVVEAQQHGVCARCESLGVQPIQDPTQGGCQGWAGCPQGTLDQALHNSQFTTQKGWIAQNVLILLLL